MYEAKTSLEGRYFKIFGEAPVGGIMFCDEGGLCKGRNMGLAKSSLELTFKTA
jgi:hypothetical protein